MDHNPEQDALVAPAPVPAAATTVAKSTPRVSISSDASETSAEVAQGKTATAAAWKGSGSNSGAGGTASHSHHQPQQQQRRGAGGRSRGHHRRLYSYPGSSRQGPVPVNNSYPHSSNNGYGYPPPAGRIGGGFGSMDGSEYQGYAYSGMAPMPWMGGHWMGGYDWSGGYGMYMVNPLHACRSERSTRIVFIANVGPSADDTVIQEAAAKFGSIRGYDSAHRETCSGVFVSYFDVRHAEAAVKGLPEVLPALGPEEQNPCATYFMMPSVGVTGLENQGTIAISEASAEVSNAEVKALFAKFGDIRSVWETNPPAPEYRFVEFFDTRCAEAAMLELKNPKLKESVLRLEYAPFAGLEPVQMPQAPYAHAPYHGMPAPKPAGEPGQQDAVNSPAQAYYGWPGYHGMPHHQHHHSYDGYLTPRNSAPEPVPDYASRGMEGMWGPPGYMGYGGPYWPYGGQPVMQPVYNEMMGVRADGNSSPGRHSASSESHNWRPHRTSRNSGDKSYDPSQFEFSLDEACSDKSNARTTLMIRNIPNKYSQKMLLDVLNRKYSSCYNFFYLPIDFKNRCNLGYAFVNFTSSAKTAEFYKEFHAKAWEEFNSKKVCEITYARVQGKDALVEHFRNSRFPCNDPDYLPLVFDTAEEGKASDGNEEGKEEGAQSKGTPVHHWANGQQYSNAQPIVAAH